MGSQGGQDLADVPGFALHLLKFERVADGALATFQVLDRDPLQQVAVTVFADNDRDGTDGMIRRAREEAINLLRRSIYLLHSERTAPAPGPQDRQTRQRHPEHRPRAGDCENDTTTTVLLQD